MFLPKKFGYSTVHLNVLSFNVLSLNVLSLNVLNFFLQFESDPLTVRPRQRVADFLTCFRIMRSPKKETSLCAGLQRERREKRLPRTILS